MFAFRRDLVMSALLGLIGLSLMLIPACSQNTAEPSALTGQSSVSVDLHQRHAGGLESQVADY